MWVSSETIVTLVTVAGFGVTLLAAILGGFAWMVRRMDAQGRELGARIDAQGARIDAQGVSLGERIDAQGERIDLRLTAVEREIVELKVAVARIEGPRPRFSTAH
jgi:hypothetical protein